MDISANMIKTLRERTGSGIMDCKHALIESKGDIEGAIDYLRKKGLSAASKKAERRTGEGLIGSYIHQGGKVGVLVEMNCETDFVAKTDDFHGLVRDIGMQVAAANPLYVTMDEVPQDVLEREKDIYKTQALESGKPEMVVDKIVEGKIKKFFSEVCLMDQPFVKEQDKSVTELVNSYIVKLGENIKVKRFARYAIGEDG
ncbi:MAG: translation elongation factor Ts [Thermodesulfobacteriota bacterium]